MSLGTPNNLINDYQWAPSGGSASATAAFTPANNSLLIVVIGGTGFSGASVAPTDITISSSPSLTFTRQLGVQDVSTTAVVFTAQISTGASTTITLSNAAGNWYTYQMSVINQTGADTSTPIGATATGTDETLGAVTITLSGAPASTSYVYGASYRSPGTFNPGWTVGSGWTQLTQNGNDPDGNTAGGIEYITGTTSTSVSWVDITTDTTSSRKQVQLGFEVKVAGAAPKSPTPFTRPLRIFPRRF